ncbi:MAG: glucoamylase family protein [Candidatus Acidiferrales bacterium]
MSTANHPPTGPKNILPLPTAAQIRSWEESIEVRAAHSANLTADDKLRVRASAVALTWKPARTEGRIEVFDARHRAASEMINKACQTIQKRISEGELPLGDAKILLDNWYVLRVALEESGAAIPRAMKLPQIEEAEFERIPRVSAVAGSYLRAANFKFDEQSFSIFMVALQDETALKSDEVWALKPFMQFELLERIAKTAGSLNIRKEAETVPLEQLAASIEAISNLEWKDTFERVNRTEQVLREDPQGAYPRMDFESRELYRKTVAEIAAHSGASELEVAKKAAELARGAQASSHASDRAKERRSHVGYYLVDGGAESLKKAVGFQTPSSARFRGFILRWPAFFYLIGIELGTIAVMAAMLDLSKAEVSGFVALALLLLPAAECAVAVMNQLSNAFVAPKSLPKLDFSRGIPGESTTMVVVPCLLASEEQIHRAVKDLEVRFLGNRDANLHFALLTDVPDSLTASDDKDALASVCSTLIADLNEKYEGQPAGSFFLFHRRRAYNPSEGTWMGWERKRGKILDFNRLLLSEYDAFPVKVGDMSVLPKVKYVITLDLDTQLPRDSAQKLVGAMAHPLNRAVINPATNTVAEGYGILQPRVGISTHSASRSRLASIFSGDTAFDVYTRAVSDVYQDLFREGTFTGKGIYDVETFHQVLNHRFPCNALLSHDMIEGAYARAGLVSDVEVIDDYPSHFSAFSRRKHRWVRGDWQIIFWLLPRVPDYFGNIVRNPISVISRWKIVDNLRRSLTEFATFVLFLSGWLFLPGNPVYWTIATLALIALPNYVHLGLSVLRAGRRVFTSEFWKDFAEELVSVHARLLLRLAFLCHQSILALDAVVRTVVRMTLTHKRLLEWETAAEAEIAVDRKSPVETYLDWTPWISLFIAAIVALARPASLLAALPILAIWGSSKGIGKWLNRPRRAGGTELRSGGTQMLRDAALRTWRFFREFSTADENWLVPDIVQEASPRIAHRVSTTNLGFLLDARLAACDLGFLTLAEFIAETERTFETIGRMSKIHGHLYNWYDTQTLQPVKPLFVSSVDNGNLVCCLWALKNGCLEAIAQPLFRPELWSGIQDHLAVLEKLVAKETRNPDVVSALLDLKKGVGLFAPADLGWVKTLPALEAEAVNLEKKISADGFSPDARWWSHELSLRVSYLCEMVQDFAPWLLPQFAKHCDLPQLRGKFGIAELTPGSASSIHAGINETLRGIAENAETDAETKSAVQFLRSALSRSISVSEDMNKRLQGIAASSAALANEMDFSIFHDAQKKLLTIGYDGEQDCPSIYHYDLLASEARAAVFVGIAKNELPQDTWFELKRTHTVYKREHVLLSWTGTMFEYLMPSLWMKTYPGTLLESSEQAAVRAQQKYAREKSIPWGISESSCSDRNPDGHYRYHAFGVPGLAIHRDGGDELVVSPYSTFLALLVDAASAAENLQKMDKMGWLGSYGFYEAADYTPSRLTGRNQYELVRCWMAHHQGISFLAAADVLCDSPMQRRFHAEPAVMATERILQEKAPSRAATDSARSEEAAHPRLEKEAALSPDGRGAAAILQRIYPKKKAAGAGSGTSGVGLPGDARASR